jgi:hypothetical protein
MMVVEHFEMVAEMNWQLAVVYLCLDLDWNHHGRERSFFAVDLQLELQCLLL